MTPKTQQGEAAWEAYLEQEKWVPNLKGLLARPAFLAGYQAALSAPSPSPAVREAFETAMRQTWKMIDPLHPPPAGSYYRGEREGICAALKTLRENFDRAIALSAPSVPPVEAPSEADTLFVRAIDLLYALANDLPRDTAQEQLREATVAYAAAKRPRASAPAQEGREPVPRVWWKTGEEGEFLMSPHVKGCESTYLADGWKPTYDAPAAAQPPMAEE